MGIHCRMDPITDGNPIGWTMRVLSTKLRPMLSRAGYAAVAMATDMTKVGERAAQVEACARETYISKRNVVKHNRGTESSRPATSASALRCAAEERRRRPGVHVLADIGGAKARPISRKPN